MQYPELLNARIDTKTYQTIQRLKKQKKFKSVGAVIRFLLDKSLNEKSTAVVARAKRTTSIGSKSA